MKLCKITKFASLILCAAMFLSFFACVGNGDITDTDDTVTTGTLTPPNDETGGENSAPGEDTSSKEEDTMETTTTNIETDSIETLPTIVLGDYAIGDSIEDAGDGLESSDFALSSHEINEDAAVSKTAAEMLALLADKKAMSAGEVYRVSEKLVLESDKIYYGNNAALIAEGGIEIANASGIIIRDLIIKGDITVSNSTELEFYMIDLKADEIGISLDMTCSEIAIKSSVISAEDIALRSEASSLSVYQSRFVSDRGIISHGNDTIVQNCRIDAMSVGISSFGEYFIAKNNTLTADNGGVGIEMTKGYNGLLALNVIDGVQRSVNVTKSFNCVVVLNSAIYVGGSDNTNLYVISNSLGGAMELRNNEYLICDGNSFPEDGGSHPVLNDGNTEINGDNVQDLSARADYGVNEELLPHSNPEQFVGMERRDSVNDITVSKGNKYYNNYIRYCASGKGKKVVIIPPGAYSMSMKLDLGQEHGNTDIYAYGVYSEASFQRTLLDINNTKNVNILGMTVGYSFPNAGQVQIVEKLGNNKVLCVVTAGFDEGFSKTNLSKYSATLVDSYRHDQAFPYVSVGNQQSAVDNGNGTYTLTYSTSAQYNLTEVGDVIVCRLATRGANTVFVGDSSGVKFKDLSVYGYSAAAAVRFMRSRNVSLERYHSDAPAPYIIDKETYDEYKALEEKYSVDLEVYIDEEGRYRGSKPRTGSSGSMEVADSYEGVSLTSCKIEHISDDGSNQRGTTSRVAGIEDNGDGTYTVYFKGCHTYIYHSEISNPVAGYKSWTVLECAAVEKGDLLLGYASNGAVLFDNAKALEDAKPVLNSSGHWAHTDANNDGKCDTCGIGTNLAGNEYPEKNTQYDPATGKITYKIQRMFGSDYLDLTTTLYSVRVKADGVNMSALDGYDLVTNDYDSSTHVFFNNLSKACAGFTFDNVLIQDHRSRGLLIKTRNVTVKHSTFKNLQCQALIMGSENVWGESSVPCNITVESCIFDNISYHPGIHNNVEYATINIQGLGEINNNITLSEHFACNNIKIHHNKFLNTNNNHVIHASGVRFLTVTDNIFETRENTGKIIYINGCLDVEISGNTYPERLQSAIAAKDFIKVITPYKYKDLTVEGTKLEDSNQNPVS